MAAKKERQALRYEGRKKRDQILSRDENKCVVCGYSKGLEVHHKLALYLGGDSSDDNLVTLCNGCHKKAPETGFNDFEEYKANPGKSIALRMMDEPKIKNTINDALLRFFDESTQDYVDQGFITEEQRDEIVIYESSKVLNSTGWI